MFVSKISWYFVFPFVYIFLALFYSIIHCPFRRIEILIQTSKELHKENILVAPYSGVGSCISKIIKTEGYRGLWKSFFIYFLTFYVAGTIVHLITSLKPNSNFYLLDFVLQIIEGLISDLILQPFKNIEVLISSDIAYGSLSKPRYHGTFDFIKKFRGSRKSYKSLYIGFSIMIAGHLLHEILVETTTVIFSLLFGKESKTFLTQLLTTVYSILELYPFEILGERDIVSGGKYGGNIFKGFKTIIKEEGVLSLYGGYGRITIFLIKFTVPIGDIIILTVEKFKSEPLN